MPEESPATLRRIAEEGARLAGKVLSERFLGERTIEYKGGIDTDLVTDADRAAEAAVLGFIRQQYPGHAVLAEESGASQGSGLRW
ncbi:MAG TPA: inositol monophosphatase family protein, partial [Archangium sp.]|nr:inositol monophosphatase family protein [Archangium sp.]